MLNFNTEENPFVTHNKPIYRLNNSKFHVEVSGSLVKKYFKEIITNKPEKPSDKTLNQFMEDFKESFSVTNENDDINETPINKFASHTSQGMIWWISEITTLKNKKVKDIKKVKLYDSTAPNIMNRFITYNVDMKTDKKDSFIKPIVNEKKYLKSFESLKCCWLKAIVDLYKSRWDEKYKDKLTIEFLYNFLTEKEYDSSCDLGFSIDEILPFFKHYKLALFIINHVNDIVYQYDPRDDDLTLHGYLRPQCAYFLLKNEHVYTLDIDDKNSLKKIKNTKLSKMKDRSLTVNDTYFTNSKNYLSNHHVVSKVSKIITIIKRNIKSYESLTSNTTTDKDEIKKNKIELETLNNTNIIYQGDIFKLFNQLIHKLKIEP